MTLAGDHPRFDGELTGRLDQVRELLAGGGRALRLLAGLDVDAPATDPHVRRGQREVQGRLDTAGVVGDQVLAGFELVQRNLIVLVTIAARGDRAVIET